MNYTFTGGVILQAVDLTARVPPVQGPRPTKIRLQGLPTPALGATDMVAAVPKTYWTNSAEFFFRRGRKRLRERMTNRLIFNHKDPAS